MPELVRGEGGPHAPGIENDARKLMRFVEDRHRDLADRAGAPVMIVVGDGDDPVVLVEINSRRVRRGNRVGALLRDSKPIWAFFFENGKVYQPTTRELEKEIAP